VFVSVSRTVSEIFSVKEWRDFEIWVKGRLRSLKKACTVSCSHSLVTLVLFVSLPR